MPVAVVTDHLFWITSRAAGTAALLLSSVAVCVGLLFGGKLVKGRPDLRHLHEALSLATIVALVVHAVALLGDNFMSPSLADISIPFVSGYQRGWTTLGIVAGWALIALGLSYYVRDRIGQQRWKKLHRFTALAWIAGIVHSLGEGTDAGATWFLAATAIVVVPALVLLVVRHLGPAGSGTPAPQAVAAQRAASPGAAARTAPSQPAASHGVAR
jgi:sulfoxide reductase heme-binding subunit YedZ